MQDHSCMCSAVELMEGDEENEHHQTSEEAEEDGVEGIEHSGYNV